jgi:hypothetical protein
LTHKSSPSHRNRKGRNRENGDRVAGRLLRSEGLQALIDLARNPVPHRSGSRLYYYRNDQSAILYLTSRRVSSGFSSRTKTTPPDALSSVRPAPR